MNLHSKKDFQDCMLSILEPLKPYYSEEKARLTLGVTMAPVSYTHLTLPTN